MKNVELGIELYLQPSYFIDSNQPDIIRFVKNTIGNEIDKTKIAIKLYQSIRDGWRYNPYNIDLRHKAMIASSIFNRENKQAYCIEKACLLAACLRVVNIPARLCFFDVRNHIGVEKLIEILGTDVLVFHACTDIYLNDKWVKATPAFNKELCDHLGVEVLEFDGENDSVFQQYDKEGGQFMEYLKDYGSFHDVPHDMFVMLLLQNYAHFFKSQSERAMIKV
ncbi:MAG: transglutaminase domain-containing protein [Chitinophagales bacterium]|nr:transglutaminase domain-containing protein [Chitinophagales bacterium]MBP6155304.1 transglutaminase domain-containing protein [Chitinophagales bacterium]